MITPGRNLRASHGAIRIELTWYRQQKVWLLCRLPTLDEFRARPERARVSRTYTQDELEDLAEAGWEFEATSWTPEEARGFARQLETGLRPHYHVALAGSCLFTSSDHDLDLLVYPHDSSAGDREQQLIVVALVLQELGLKRTRTFAQVHKYWRKRGSNDEKQVEVWYLGDRRVDIIHVR